MKEKGGGGEREIHRPKDFSQLSHTFNSVLILGLTISSSTFASFHNFFSFCES